MSLLDLKIMLIFTAIKGEPIILYFFGFILYILLFIKPVRPCYANALRLRAIALQRSGTRL